MESIFSQVDKNLQECLGRLSCSTLAPLDLLGSDDLREKFIELVFRGTPPGLVGDLASQFGMLRRHLINGSVDEVRVVVFGGGSGLSNIIGGDSRMSGWASSPFHGMKEIFPLTRSIVCVTDDGGSTGELLKDIPLIAIGDIRHVLLSSVQLPLLQKIYGISRVQALELVEALAYIFNFRFEENQFSREFVERWCNKKISGMPGELQEYLCGLMARLIDDERFQTTVKRAHCLGNLFIVAAIYGAIPEDIPQAEVDEDHSLIAAALTKGLETLSLKLGTGQRAVMPCTTTPAQLRMRYANGVEVTGEYKSSAAHRGYPVERVHVSFSRDASIDEKVKKDIEEADIIIMAPGSLFTSIIPIFQVPGMAEAVRNNTSALKLLISNLWVQTGETDIVVADPERKFHVSDMIRAYQRNIPGGTDGLFKEVLCLSLKDVPASILQNYAVEGKVPIYLDKDVVKKQGYDPLECGIFSRRALADRGVIQHDPELLATAVKTIYLGARLSSQETPPLSPQKGNPEGELSGKGGRYGIVPSKKYRQMREWVMTIPFTLSSCQNGKDHDLQQRENILEILWKHQDIPLEHLRFVSSLVCIDTAEWVREQKWDKVYSFYNPENSSITIREDRFSSRRALEVALLIALGQSLLGNYAARKDMQEVVIEGKFVGKIYHLYLSHDEEMRCYFSREELDNYLHLARMRKQDGSGHYTRLVNGTEGFTPPGLLMGLLYAWYLDNTLATHIEYKMSLLQINESDLIPEQKRMLGRRQSLIRFFNTVVFRQGQ